MPIDLLTAARDLIAIDSRSSVSDRAVVDYLVPLCRQAGLSVSLQDELRDGVRQWNLLAARAPTGRPHDTSVPDRLPDERPVVLLATHLDTVPPGDPDLWTKTDGRPLRLTERDGLLYGLGTADVKLDFLCKLIALERLRDVPLTGSVALAGTYGEEVGRWGAKLLTRTMRPLPRSVLVGEPTGLRPCTAHKGYLEIRSSATGPTVSAPAGPWWRLRFEGVTAHSSQPHKGRSANDACLDALTALWTGAGPPVAELKGGELVNKVAAAAEVLVCSRTAPDVTGAHVTPAAAPLSGRWSPALVMLLLDIHRRVSLLRRLLEGTAVPGFEPPHSTVNNGLVTLADDTLRHVCDVRRTPHEASEEVLSRSLSELAALPAQHADCRVRVEPWLDEPPFRAADDSRLVPALDGVLRAAGRPTTPEYKSGTTEATAYGVAGLDAVVFGPGEAAGNIHRPNEHVPIADLHAAIDLYGALVRRLCDT